jgi:SAM-dependent methyltransferase
MRFNERAATYDLHAAPQRHFALGVAEFIGNPPPAQALELGAGTGALTRELLARGFDVEATDASPAMLDLGKSALPGVHWRQLDAFSERLPQVVLQVSSGLLQWAPEPEQVLGAWRAGLLPGGRMVHAFPCEPCLNQWRQVSHHSPIVWRTPAEWVELFERAGLKVKRQQLWTEQFWFSSALEMVRSMHASGVTGAPSLTTAQLRQAVREYQRLYGTGQGVPATWAWLAIEAVASGSKSSGGGV